ncbi:MAG TPA: V-type ATP synthase subunit D [Clostridia bacterium]|nr:V-type ATP synthase subunit D [Clostridia bacterium]
MAKRQINPTRMELTRLKRKLATAMRGHKLLKDKRDELMRQFLALVKKNMALREEVEGRMQIALGNFALARASMQSAALDTALLVPGQEIALEVDTHNVMSVNIPKFTYKFRNADLASIYAYGLGLTSGDLDEAVLSLAEALPDMITLAETEQGCKLMAAEIEKTRRRVNALEYVIIPEMQQNIKYISMKLDESERSTQIRLMKVKDMVLEQTYHYSER